MKKRRHEASNLPKVTVSVWEISSVIQKYFLSTCYVLGPGLSAGEIAMSKTTICPEGLNLKGGGGKKPNKQVKGHKSNVEWQRALWRKMTEGVIVWGRILCLGERGLVGEDFCEEVTLLQGPRRK